MTAAPALAALLLAGCLGVRPACAVEPERWRPVGRSAVALTGEVAFGGDRIMFESGAGLDLRPETMVDPFDLFGEEVAAMLYRVIRPDDPLLLNGQRLCGADQPRPVTYIAVWRPAAGPRRGMAAFAGEALPRTAGSNQLCAAFTYEAAP